MPPSAGVALLPARAAIHIAGAIVALAAILSPASAGLLYFTEFEDPPFLVGPDRWVGTDGWIGNSTGLGVHGIDNQYFVGNDQTAYLGFAQPDTLLVVVAKPLNHDPVAQGTAQIVIDTFLGIEDSTNGFRDSFWLTIYNIAGDLLGALRFSNDLATYGIWRYDGVNEFDTGLAFIHGELHLLCVEIDFQGNCWKADLDGIPLFQNRPLTATAHPRTFGSCSYEWQLTSNNVAEHGDNWMLIADSFVWAIPPGEQNFLIDQIAFDSEGQPRLEFTFEPGWTYQIEYTDTLTAWLSDLPNSTFSGATETTQQGFTDLTSGPPTRRYYRVVRTVTP
jgi:hypothetical protein